jgi:trehalose 6-phosphate synthase/phosphatase
MVKNAIDPEGRLSGDADPRLLVVSNRLPVSLSSERGVWTRQPGSGGLVTALEPVLRDRGGIWIGWSGVVDGDLSAIQAELDRTRGDEPYALRAVPLSADDKRDFYQGAANEMLWPLFHGLIGRCNYQHRYWRAYREVNWRFAHAILEVARPGDFVWVQDYHLLTVAEELRALGFRDRLAFFLHIPFPCLDVFEQLPWAEEVLRALLRYDLVGFQTERDLRNFIQCVEAMAGEEVVVEEGRVRLARTGRSVRVGAFPISIDTRLFFEGASDPHIRAEAEALLARFSHQRVVLGVDRLDYTKGIPEKLLGLERALEKYPELRGQVTLFQLVVPSRERIPEYSRMKVEIEGLVGRINGRFTRGGWVPILYSFGSWSQDELLAYYRLAHVALITPLRDGMNLVSKEFVAASSDESVLILSAFAGAAQEMRDGALLVNPHDIEAVADAIYRACTMDPQEKARRIATLRERVRVRDVHRWVEDFLLAARDVPAPAAMPGTRGWDARLPISGPSRRPGRRLVGDPSGPLGGPSGRPASA